MLWAWLLTSVLAQVAAKSPAWALQVAGSSSRGRKWGPCPACRGDSARGYLLVSDRAWTCVKCGTSANSLGTIALLAVGECRPAEWGAVATWIEERGLVGDGDDWAPPVAPDVEVRGRLPVALSWVQSVNRAVAAGVPHEIAARGAREYLECRAEEQARTLEAATVARGSEDPTLRRVSVALWAEASTVEETITVGREVLAWRAG